MKKLITKIGVAICALLVLNSHLVLASTDTDAIKALIEHKIMVEKKAVGVAIAIIENDKVKYLNFGISDQQSKHLITSDTIFEIGSISKTFTSSALASMVEEGKVKLTDPVQKYLPKNVKMPTRNGKEITLVSLANHTSGLPPLPSNMPFSDPLDPYADFTIDMMYVFLNGYKLTRDVGEKIEYSNLAVGLLGHVLGLIDHKTYQQVISDRVLKPLLMSNTFVDLPDSEMQRFSDGHTASLQKSKHWQLPTLAGAGAIKSNTNDMALYAKANLKASSTSIEKVISLTHKQTTKLGGNSPKVGLAWFKADYKGGSYLWHNGGTGGFRSFIGFDQTKNRAIVILENTVNGMDEIGNAFLAGTLAKLKSDTFDVIAVSEQKLERLNGRYELMPGFIMTVTNQGQQLFIQATGQQNIAVTAKSEIEFVNLAARAKITFELNDKGQAVSLTLHQGGNDKKAIKLTAGAKATQRSQVTLTKLQLDNLLGEFKLTPTFSITTTHSDGHLIIQATGQQKISFDARSNSEFFNPVVQAKIVFELGSNGKAISLILFQGGQELKGVRQ